MTRRNVHSIASIPVGLDRPTITTRDVTTELLGDGLDPFLVASLFDMKDATFPPHPHAGFTVTTYLLPESETAFLNQDSTGLVNRIAPGGLHATVAGSGVLHEETNETNGLSAIGLQIWLNMRAAEKLTSPRPISLDARDVPVVHSNGATIRVLSGASNGRVSPMVLPTAVRLVDVALQPGAVFEQDLMTTENAFLWMIAGSIDVVGDTARSQARAFEAVRLDSSGDRCLVEAGEAGARFVLFAGEPIREGVVMDGPFVGANRQQLDSFWADFRAGRMGTLTPFVEQNRNVEVRRQVSGAERSDLRPRP